ncbi:MAG: lipid-binding SYLF domain-containing protein [Pseudomonadota bacterium]
MNNFRSVTLAALLGIAAPLSLALVSPVATAATAEDLNRSASQALDKLYRSNPVAAAMGKQASGILVFPNVVKAGLIFGGSYGEGVLLKNGAASGYYNSVSASWGLQAGAQSYGYVMFLMNDKSLSYLEASKGWEVGVGPNVVVVNDGLAKSLTSTTLTGDTYAFVFDQQGLMASLSIEGSKISRIQR